MWETIGIGGLTRQAGAATRRWFGDRQVYALGAVVVLVASLLFAVLSDLGTLVARLVAGWLPTPAASGWLSVALTLVAFAGLVIVFMAATRQLDLRSGRENPPVPLAGKRGIYAWLVAGVIIGSLLADAASAFMSELMTALIPAGGVACPALRIVILGAVSAVLFVLLTDVIGRIWREGRAYKTTRTKTVSGTIRSPQGQSGRGEYESRA